MAPARSWRCPRMMSGTTSSRQSSDCRSNQCRPSDQPRSSKFWITRANSDRLCGVRRCLLVFSEEATRDYGIAVNSGFLDGLPTAEAKAKMIDLAGIQIQRQAPHPVQAPRLVVLPPALLGRAVPDHLERRPPSRDSRKSELPLLAPPLDDYKPSGTPEPILTKATAWVELPDGSIRETNTMPQWAGSCWYYLRYCDPKNTDRFISNEAEAYWTDEKPGMVDLYVGGTEHAVLHLLYARFWHKVLFDLGHVSTRSHSRNSSTKASSSARTARKCPSPAATW